MGANPDTPDNSEDWNSVLLCTGANACGKVWLSISSPLSGADSLQECIHETGECWDGLSSGDVLTNFEPHRSL